MRPRVLFVTHHKPWPANYGAAIRALAQLRALEAIAEVDLAILGSLGTLRDDPFYRQRRVVAELPWSVGLHQPFLQTLIAKQTDGGYWLSTYLPGFPALLKGPATVRATFQELTARGYDALYMIRPETYWYLAPRGRQTVVDIDDVQSLHAMQAWLNARGWLKSRVLGLRLANLRRAEAALLRDCAAGLVCSEEDARKLDHAHAVVLPNPIPDHNQAVRPVTAGDSNRLLFVGALKYRPNLDAVQFFARAVLPQIRALAPNAVLSVIGAYREADRFALGEGSGVNLMGFVDSLRDTLEAAAVVVAPLREGLGTRLKILEALSFGKPVVATHTGAYGIDLGPEDGLFREDDPVRMAAICLELMQNPTWRMRLGERGKEQVYAAYGLDSFVARVREILEQAIRAKK